MAATGAASPNSLAEKELNENPKVGETGPFSTKMDGLMQMCARQKHLPLNTRHTLTGVQNTSKTVSPATSSTTRWVDLWGKNRFVNIYEGSQNDIKSKTVITELMFYLCKCN